MMKYAPMGDPMEIRLRGYELTLRRADAARIELVDVHDTDTVAAPSPHHESFAHPALGEGVTPRGGKMAIAAGDPIRFALAGNQNCGKTTLFNQLTGSNQHVGNFPGVTVDRKDGTIRNHPEATVTDLPGIYSLSPYTGEEVVSRQFILDSQPDGIEHIISQMEEESGTDRLSALADMRFSFIEGVCQACVTKPHESREHLRSVAIDRVLTGRYTAIPMFLFIMAAVFWLTFGAVGAPLQGLMEQLVGAGVSAIDDALAVFGTNPVVKSLVVDGVLAGVGGVLSFLPIIVVLFLLLSILEDSGYMARWPLSWTRC